MIHIYDELHVDPLWNFDELFVQIFKNILFKYNLFKELLTFNSVRQSDANMRQRTKHHRFR